MPPRTTTFYVQPLFDDEWLTIRQCCRNAEGGTACYIVAHNTYGSVRLVLMIGNWACHEVAVQSTSTMALCRQLDHKIRSDLTTADGHLSPSNR
jgi:hypothetical protein